MDDNPRRHIPKPGPISGMAQLTNSEAAIERQRRKAAGLPRKIGRTKCRECVQEKPLRALDLCRECSVNLILAYPDRTSGTYKRYGLTKDEHLRMFLSQLGRCLICRLPRKLVIDHDHATGRVRGLLCAPCNSAIGLLSEDRYRLGNARAYLNEL